MTQDEIKTVFERGIAMAKLFNLRCGFTSADDRLPARFLEPLKTGPFADKPLTEEQVRKVVTDYYAAHGWDEQTGAPKPETLEKLGIAEYAPA